MKNYSSVIITIFLMLFIVYSAEAQQSVSSNSDPKTGIRVTTIIKPLPTLSDQVRDIEIKLSEAEKDEKLVTDGTVDKYRLVLNQLKKDLEAENDERKRIEALKKK